MEKFDRAIYKTLLSLCAFLMFAMLLLIFSQVVARYLLHRSLSWSEEIGRYIFIWMSFIGMAAALKQGSHVALDLLLKALGGKAKKALILLNGILIAILSSTIFYSGIVLVQNGARQKSPALKLPMNWVYLIMPVCGAILLYFSIRQTYTGIITKDDQTDMFAEGDFLRKEGDLQ